jgi:hypothetical protein
MAGYRLTPASEPKKNAALIISVVRAANAIAGQSESDRDLQ